MRNVVVAAVVAALVSSGGAYAASGLISGKQIRNHSIAASKLTPSAIRHLHGLRGATGATGATGAQGPIGPQGAPGGFGPSKVTQVAGSSVSVAAHSSGAAAALCPSGEVAISGGGVISNGILTGSFPYQPSGDSYPVGWVVTVVNPQSSAENAAATVVCGAS